MKIRIQKQNLLQQLPEVIRIQLVRDIDSIPEYFVFDGFAPEESQYEKMLKKYPEFRRVCTPVEFAIFSDLHGKEDGVPLNYLGRHVRTNRTLPYEYRNTIQVHIKNLRRKLHKVGMHFEITTERASRFSNGKYYLVSTNKTLR